MECKLIQHRRKAKNRSVIRGQWADPLVQKENYMTESKVNKLRYSGNFSVKKIKCPKNL